MNQNNNPYQPPKSELEVSEIGLDIVGYRKRLIPKWIKVFGWLFIVFGSLVPLIGIYAAISGVAGRYSLYGLEATGTVYSPLAIFIMFLFVAHAVCAFGLLFAKSWGLNACIVLGYISVIICIVTMVTSIVNYNSMNLRLELVILIPYLIKLHKMRPEWNGGSINITSHLKADAASDAV